MASQMKRVTALGLGLVLTGGLLTACEPAQSTSSETAESSGAQQSEATPTVPPQGGDSRPVPVLEMGEAGAGGEGEGGVAVADAFTSPVIYNSALAIAAAHVYAARDAHAAGQHEAAAEMFAHPVSEVLLDMEPVFEARGVALFSERLLQASQAVFEGDSPAEIAHRADTILTLLAQAADQAPDDGSTPAEIAAGVIVDQIDRASDMYRIARETGEYGPYLDGYGFLKSAQSVFAQNEAAIVSDRPHVATRIQDALTALSAAYTGASMPEILAHDPADLSAVSSAAMLAVLYE